jgi:UDP-N-acetylmuramoyl-tripeptide--D-alanyl-D-alanine ligase
MIEFSAAQIAAVTGGKLTAGTSPSLAVRSAAVDSREMQPDGLFIAKPGEQTDGHHFVGQAFDRGAALALLERPVEGPAGGEYPAVLVPDAVEAMGTLAAEVVRRLRDAGPLTVIGITGSAGKTTTKDLLAGILAPHGTTVAPVGSYNGEVGVPLTVFNAEYGTRYLVIEMGATGIGHISYLAGMVRPDIGVVLGVGSAHAGEFGGIENIAVAKGELLEALSPSGTAVINADDPRVRAMESRTDARRLYFTADPEYLRATDPVIRADGVHSSPDGCPAFNLAFPSGESYPVQSRLLGAHQTTNLLAAAAAATAAGIEPADTARTLSTLGAASRWRMERTDRADGVTIINDAYNANPESMRAALRTLAELGTGRRTWAVLGEMLELGDTSTAEHDALGRTVVRLNISKLLVVGPGARAIHAGAVLEGSWGDEAIYAGDADKAEAILQEQLRPGDMVLFKSSNGSGLRFLGDRIALHSSTGAAVESSSAAGAAEPVPGTGHAEGGGLQ